MKITDSIIRQIKNSSPLIYVALVGLVPGSGELRRVLTSLIAGLIAYYAVKNGLPDGKLPPINIEDLIHFDKSISDKVPSIPRGGTKKFIKNLIARIFEDPAFKRAIITALTAYGLNRFMAEILPLFSSDQTMKAIEDGKIPIKINEIINDLDLEELDSSISKLVLNKDLSEDQKIKILTIKLNRLINGEYSNKTIVVVAILISILLSLIIFERSGLRIFLSAIYRLWKEGKISRETYERLAKEAIRKAIPVEVEN